MKFAARKTEGAFADLLFKIIKMTDDNAFAECLSLKNNNLPIRPLILGGDDLTFVCPANMSIMFTKTLMKLMDTETPENAPEHLTSRLSRHMDCCAGVAILPTSYPFFRGYILAEQLCDYAKKSMRSLLPEGINEAENLTIEDIPVGSSWLDFAILHGEQAPTLEQIRNVEYRGVRGDMHFGAYQIGNSTAKITKDRRQNIENLIECTTQFLQSKKKNPPKNAMAHNKIKELRNVLHHGKDETARFLRQLKYQKQNLPDIEDWKSYLNEDNLLWSSEKNSKTPYVDAIELMDFYIPEVELKWQNLKY